MTSNNIQQHPIYIQQHPAPSNDNVQQYTTCTLSKDALRGSQGIAMCFALCQCFVSLPISVFCIVVPCIVQVCVHMCAYMCACICVSAQMSKCPNRGRNPTQRWTS